MLTLDEPSGADLGRVFVAQRSQLKAVALKILGNVHRAEDVVQDAYLKLLEAPVATEVHQPVAYLFQLVRNLAIDRHRLRLVSDALASLPERTRRAFELYRLGGVDSARGGARAWHLRDPGQLHDPRCDDLLPRRLGHGVNAPAPGCSGCLEWAPRCRVDVCAWPATPSPPSWRKGACR